ncbi:helix-turn-helix transcriptional regulator [Nesterenkonia sp. CF4.4]|uniref:helix-turn-helix transcriptional regulator n=1 Tax=Nesterenkonia sp. CF4.4 TaxID=3373079 RepID=UPI003EE6652C
MSDPRLRSIEDFAEMTGVPVATIRHWRIRGEGPPAVRLGKRLYWKEQDILDWIEGKFEEQKQVSA